MLRTIRGFFLTSTTFIGGILLGFGLIRQAWSIGQDPYDPLRQLARVISIIQNNHIQQLDLETLVHGGIAGMVEELDPHSHYMGPKEYKRLRSQASGWSVGMGIELNKEKTILRIAPKSPAAIAGLLVGDKLLEIDNVSLKNTSLAQINKLLSGDKGQIKRVLLLRNGDKRQFQLTLDEVQQDYTDVLIIKPKYLYIRLERFSKGAVRKIIQKQQQLEKKPKGIILDLRDNPGGLIEEGIDLADLFLDKGELISLIERTGEASETFSAKPAADDLLKPKLIVLINKNSASAAELCAGVLQIHKRAKLLGTPSYGKGSMQKIYEFNGKTALKLTVAQYRLSDGRTLTPNSPLKPDYTVKGLIDNPKKELIAEINQLPIDKKTKTRLLQRASLLKATTQAVALPQDKDFSVRLYNDPQLKRAWNLLTNKD